MSFAGLQTLVSGWQPLSVTIPAAVGVLRQNKVNQLLTTVYTYCRMNLPSPLSRGKPDSHSEINKCQMTSSLGAAKVYEMIQIFGAFLQNLRRYSTHDQRRHAR